MENNIPDIDTFIEKLKGSVSRVSDRSVDKALFIPLEWDNAGDYHQAALEAFSDMDDIKMELNIDPYRGYKKFLQVVLPAHREKTKEYIT